MIETLVVDLAGVAARFVPERRLKALSNVSGLPELLIQARLFDSGFEIQAELGMYSLDQVLAKIRDAIETNLPLEALLDGWSLAFEPDEGVLERVSSVQAQCVLFTNNGPMIRACLAGPLAAVGSVFGQIITSADIQARKPDLAAFERAALRLASSPHRLTLLDDSAENVQAASRCGWDAYCVTGEDQVTAAIEQAQRRHRSPPRSFA